MSEQLSIDHDADFVRATQAAWHRQLAIVARFEATNRLAQRRQEALAAVLYRTWLERNQTAHNHLVHFNHGVVLFTAQDFHGALDAYGRALHLAPDFLQPRFNLGLTYERLGMSDAAIAQWLWIESECADLDAGAGADVEPARRDRRARQQIGQLSTQQLVALTSTQLQAIGTDQISSLTGTQIKALSTTQVSALTDTQVKNLGANQCAR